MDKAAWPELLLAGFFAIGCIRGRFGQRQNTHFLNFFHMSGRLERLRRSRWEWFSMAAIMLVLRLQHQLPPAVEIIVGMVFLIFVVFPVRAFAREGR